MAGQTSVMGNPQLQVIYSSKFETKGEQWAATLPKVCVWFDYVSIPQPGAVEDAASADAAPSVKKMPSLKKMATSDHRVIDAAATAVESSSSHASHTEGAAAEGGARAPARRRGRLDPELRRAQRADVGARAADGAQPGLGRRRRLQLRVVAVPRWCRMEFAAAKLACGDEMPAMIIEGERPSVGLLQPVRHVQAALEPRRLLRRRRPHRRQQDARIDAARQGRARSPPSAT